MQSVVDVPKNTINTTEPLPLCSDSNSSTKDTIRTNHSRQTRIINTTHDWFLIVRPFPKDTVSVYSLPVICPLPYVIAMVSPVFFEVLVCLYFLDDPTHVLELPVSIKRVSTVVFQLEYWKKIRARIYTLSSGATNADRCGILHGSRVRHTLNTISFTWTLVQLTDSAMVGHTLTVNLGDVLDANVADLSGEMKDGSGSRCTPLAWCRVNVGDGCGGEQ